MSGLLQRLAARATGNAWTVRSDARLPFAAPMAMEEPATSPPAVQDAALPMAPHRHAQRPTTSPHRDASTDGPAVPQPLPSAGAPNARGAARTEPIDVPPLFQPQPVFAAPTPALRTASEDAAPTGFAPQRQMPDGDPRPGSTVAAPAERQTVRPTPADPPALMPSRSTRSPRRHTPSVSTSAPRTPAATPMATATEVHVHIGRIEVTALQAPVARPRPARERTQPVSLDAYLAKKKAT